MLNVSDEKRLTLHDADADDFSGLRDRIVELAGQGFSASYISNATCTSYTKVCRILRSEWDERRSNRENIIRGHDQTLQWLKLKYTDAISKSEVDKKTGRVRLDHKAAEILLRILERESKLYGIDQPTQHNVEVTVNDDQTTEELLEQLKQAGLHISLPAAPPVPLSLPEQIEDALIEAEPARPAEADAQSDQQGERRSQCEESS